MQAQQPAEGILKINDWGASKMYKAVCDCGSDDCSHTLDIEADDSHVTVTIYTQQKTNFWSVTRWQHIWNLLIKGHTTFETSLVMREQTALNYAETLRRAVKDVSDLRKKL